MGRVPYSEFVGSRARFQRLSDQRVFSGWLNELQNDAVQIRTSGETSLQINDRFLFQVQGQSADAYFIAKLSSISDESVGIQGQAGAQTIKIPEFHFAFELVTHIQLRDAQQKARRSIDAMAGKLQACGRSFDVLITDASAGGMGILLWQELQRGDVIQIDLRSNDVELSLTCEVRHCRPEPKLTGAFRIGLRFQESDRVALTQWRKLTEAA